MQMLADEEGMYAYRFEGERYDTGRPLGLLMASIAMGLRRAGHRAGAARATCAAWTSGATN